MLRAVHLVPKVSRSMGALSASKFLASLFRSYFLPLPTSNFKLQPAFNPSSHRTLNLFTFLTLNVLQSFSSQRLFLTLVAIQLTKIANNMTTYSRKKKALVSSWPLSDSDNATTIGFRPARRGMQYDSPFTLLFAVYLHA